MLLATADMVRIPGALRDEFVAMPVVLELIKLSMESARAAPLPLRLPDVMALPLMEVNG